MTISRALRLESGGDCHAAVAPHDVIEVLAEAQTTLVPLASAYCHELIEWRGNPLPVFDLGRWRDPGATPGTFLAVVAYQDAPGQPIAHGRPRLVAFSRMVQVEDAHACALPDAKWQTLAGACFLNGDSAVSILSLERVLNHSGLHQASDETFPRVPN